MLNVFMRQKCSHFLHAMNLEHINRTDDFPYSVWKKTWCQRNGQTDYGRECEMPVPIRRDGQVKLNNSDRALILRTKLNDGYIVIFISIHTKLIMPGFSFLMCSRCVCVCAVHSLNIFLILADKLHVLVDSVFLFRRQFCSRFFQWHKRCSNYDSCNVCCR